MPQFLSHWVHEFVTLLVILDPIATVPLFLSASAGLSRGDANKLAIYSVSAAFLMLTFFIACGQLLLDAMNIPMASFQLAGSLLFLLLGIRMATGQVHGSQAVEVNGNGIWSRAIYPLATPGIAGGGGILTVVMLTDNKTRTIEEQLTTVVILLACLSIHLMSFMLSTYIIRWLGPNGIQIISRIFGLILISVAVNGIIVAIKLSFNLQS